MRNKFAVIILFFLLFLLPFSLFSLNFITTAESISWNGAYTSVADGFEAMLYNPAGLYFTPSKYGFNILGTYGVRIFSNSISSDNFISMFKVIQNGENLSTSGILANLIQTIPSNGFSFGLDASFANVMSYTKFTNFSIGVSVLPKTWFNFTGAKALFTTLFQQLDLTMPLSYSLKSTMLQYMDLNVILSTRAKFLERVIPVEKIFVGFAGHFYLPTFYMKSDALTSLTPGTPDPVFGFVDNYTFTIKGSMLMSANSAITEILKLNPTVNQNVGSLLSAAGSVGFGLGLDLGFLIQFNRYVRLGFSITDLGFIVFPQAAKISLDYQTNINFTSIFDFPVSLRDEIIRQLITNSPKVTPPEWYMPNTAARVGIAVTPFKDAELFIWSSDISVADFNLIIDGGYPSFNFSTGIQFAPGYKWFKAPLRAAFNYNSQANAASFSFGTGLYFGPVEMEIGVKGLEFMITGWGAKELAVGFDFKFEF